MKRSSFLTVLIIALIALLVCIFSYSPRFYYMKPMTIHQTKVKIKYVPDSALWTYIKQDGYIIWQMHSIENSNFNEGIYGRNLFYVHEITDSVCSAHNIAASTYANSKP